MTHTTKDHLAFVQACVDPDSVEPRNRPVACHICLEQTWNLDGGCNSHYRRPTQAKTGAVLARRASQLAVHAAVAARGDGGVSDERLYGTPGAEILWGDPATVYETEIEGDVGDLVNFIVEEWTVSNPRSLLVSAEHLAEHVSEMIDEVSDLGYERLADAAADPEVVAAFDTAVALMASKWVWRQADTKVTDHYVTFDANGEPLYDGEPMYRPVPP